MPTTGTSRTPESTTRTKRSPVVRYVSLLQDSDGVVCDDNSEQIYVYTDSGIEVGGTAWTKRTPI